MHPMRQYIAKFKLLTETLLMVCLTLCSTSSTSADPPVGVGERDAAKQGSGLSIADLFQKTSPAVVKIFVNGESHKGVATGSGFIVAWPTPDSCEVVTNYHVIRPGVGATIEFENGAIADVENVLVENDSADLALLAVRLRSKVSVHPSWPPDVRAKMEEEASKESNPPTRRLIDVKADARPPVGTRVIAIGSPKGMTNTLSDGLISGYRTQDAKKDWIQITNPIGPGSSGGPLLDETGRFVGVTTASFDDAQNLNFAVPASAVRTLLEEKRLPRALWKGSSIDAEERAVYREIFDEAFSKRCGSSDDLKNERERVDDYFNSVNLPPEVLAVGGMDQDQRFQKYWEELARMDDPFALVIRGCYDTNWGGSNWGGPLEKRMRDAIQSLKRTLQKTERFRFFVLYKIGEAEWYLADLTRRQVIPTQPADPKVYAQALEYLRMARTANPDFAPSFNLLAILLTEAGQYSEALTATKYPRRNNFINYFLGRIV